MKTFNQKMMDLNCGKGTYKKLKKANTFYRAILSKPPEYQANLDAHKAKIKDLESDNVALKKEIAENREYWNNARNNVVQLEAKLTEKDKNTEALNALVRANSSLGQGDIDSFCTNYPEVADLQRQLKEANKEIEIAFPRSYAIKLEGKVTNLQLQLSQSEGHCKKGWSEVMRFRQMVEPLQHSVKVLGEALVFLRNNSSVNMEQIKVIDQALKDISQ